MENKTGNCTIKPKKTAAKRRTVSDARQMMASAINCGEVSGSLLFCSTARRRTKPAAPRPASVKGAGDTQRLRDRRYSVREVTLRSKRQRRLLRRSLIDVPGDVLTRKAAAAAPSPSGTLTQKMLRQPRHYERTSPITGPSVLAREKLAPNDP